MQIKETMQRYGYSPTSLAKKMGVYASTVIRLTDGNPTVDKLDELAQWIGCQRWEFFKDEIEAAGYRLTAGPAPQPQEKMEASAEDTSDSNNEKCGGDAPKEGAEQGAASTGAAPEAPKQAEAAQVLRFQYGCPHCGHQIQVCISEV